MLDECIEWSGSRNKDGYGQKHKNGKTQQAHRLAYECAFGTIPAGMLVCHSCDNPPCINPAHLFLGTNQDNIRDSVEKGRHSNKNKTHCPQSHPYDTTNTVWWGNRRHCRTCQNERRRERYKRNRSCVEALP